MSDSFTIKAKDIGKGIVQNTMADLKSRNILNPLGTFVSHVNLAISSYLISDIESCDYICEICRHYWSWRKL
jgi:hypothetical protein